MGVGGYRSLHVGLGGVQQSSRASQASWLMAKGMALGPQSSVLKPRLRPEPRHSAGPQEVVVLMPS